jgi:glucose/mannose-6-phosphate isomerase
VREYDADLLDDPGRLASGDPAGMLRAVATGAAQVRESAQLAAEAGVAALADDGRPRAIVTTGMGGSGIAGGMLAAVAGPGCPVPIVVHRGDGLPGWVGAADLVVAVSCSGTTDETVSAAEVALRRGARMLGVGAPHSPLSDLVARAHGVYVSLDAAGRLPRAMVWALATPLMVAADALGLLSCPAAAIEAVAARLEEVAVACRPDSESFLNPAKELAAELAGSLPMVWGAGLLMGTAAYRLGCQLAENAKYPAITGTLPEANHNQVVAFDGAFAGREAAVGLRLVLLRGADEYPQVARRVDASADLAAEHDVPVTQLRAEGESAYERLASVVGLTDFASVYLALAQGIDPTPIAPIVELKQRVRQA